MKMKSNIWMIIILLFFVSGCVTVKYPDGSTETKIDVDMATVVLNTAVEAYNLYLQHEQTPEPTKLERLLNNIERAEAIYNRLAEQFGEKQVQVNKNQDGLMEIIANVESN